MKATAFKTRDSIRKPRINPAFESDRASHFSEISAAGIAKRWNRISRADALNKKVLAVSLEISVLQMLVLRIFSEAKRWP